MSHQALSCVIWSVAGLLRGDHRQSEYGPVILPFTAPREECHSALVAAAISGQMDVRDPVVKETSA